MRNIIYILIAGWILIFTACSDNFLDRPPKDSVLDEKYWLDEAKIRYYVNAFYPYFFTGYNTGYSTVNIPVKSYIFSDDVTPQGQQANFPQQAPASLGSSEPITHTDASVIQNVYAGPTWYFGWIREANIMLYHVERMYQKKLLTEEAYKHWMGVGKFFRALEYSRLVATFGDIPYFEEVLTMETDPKIVYKDRDSRNDVMDKIYDDFAYAVKNIRNNDGAATVNKFVAAAFASRWMLFEGTWQKYHKNNSERSKKFLKFAIETADIVRNSSSYDIQGDYRSVFASNDLSAHKEVLIYRSYSETEMVMHAMVGYTNTTEEQTAGANLNALRAFICTDGKPWQNSTVSDADKFDLSTLIKTRDPRFEAIFHDQPLVRSSTRLYTVKYAPRESIGLEIAPWKAPNNITAAPIIRYAEVLLNWIEAKAELETFGEVPVSQSDIDNSINKLRQRPLAQEAIKKGVTQTVPLSLANINGGAMVDPDKDPDTAISSLIWEIRRERRMELMYEFPRLLDLRRWKKLSYMDNVKYPLYKNGPWVDYTNAGSDFGKTLVKGFKVLKADLTTVVTYDETNRSEMIGFFQMDNVADRDQQWIKDRSYLSPIGENEIIHYETRGYTLNQTEGW